MGLPMTSLNPHLRPRCAPVKFHCVTQSEQLNALQNKALIKLGRNVLHFQRLEAQLKLLVLFRDFQSPVDQFVANHKKNAKAVRMKTMGALVSELHEGLYGKPTDPQTTEAITEAKSSSNRIVVFPVERQT